MAPNPPTSAERDEVRDEFIASYKKLAALKEVLLALGPGGERHQCASAFLTGLVLHCPRAGPGPVGPRADPA